MTEAKKSLFDGSSDWEARAFEVIADPSVEYDGKRQEMLIKRAFTYSGSLPKSLKPSEGDSATFTNKLLTFNLEDIASKRDDDIYTRRMAEVAFTLDGLYGVAYPELGRIYRDSIRTISRDGPYAVWRSMLGAVVKVARDKMEISLKEPETQDIENVETAASATANVVSMKNTAIKREYKSPAEPDYADIQDVVKYLYQAGILSPSHAAALMVTLGFQRPEGGISDELKNDMIRIRSDLRARIAAYQAHPYNIHQDKGLRVLESFIAQSSTKPDLQLSLPNPGVMVSVGIALVDIHRQGEVRGKQQSERPDKYDGMGAIIDFGE